MARVYARIGHAKQDLQIGIKRLNAAIKLKGLPESKKRDFEDAIKKMEQANKLLIRIPCIQPDMSLPFYYSPPPGGRTTATRGRKAVSRKSQKKR